MSAYHLTLNRDLIMALDAECMPGEEPPEFDGAQWFIANQDSAYCAWRPVKWSRIGLAGFLYRSGVRQSWRGVGMQSDMIRLRERCMVAAGLKVSVTYTDADNSPSMRSLMGCGYKPYAPEADTCLSGVGRLGRCGFVHWKRDLT